MNTKCFKIKRGTKYDKAVKEHFSLLPKWSNVYDKVGELLDEKITRMGLVTDELHVDLNELTKEENRKLFTKDGRLKNNTKAAKRIRERYKQIIKDEGLSDFQELRLINFTYGVMHMRGQELRLINFTYGVMHMRGQELRSFGTSEHDIYYKADFYLKKKTNGLVEPISEIEYEEKYLEELKKREKVG